LKTRYAGRAEFAWRIALLHPSDFPPARAQTDGFYPRSGGTVMRSPFRLNSGPFEAERQGHYGAPNLVAEAAREFGFAGDEIRLALSSVGVREGQKIGDLATAVAVAAKASGKKLPAKKSAPPPSPPPSARGSMPAPPNFSRTKSAGARPSS
jgi:hypothetical protein